MNELNDFDLTKDSTDDFLNSDETVDVRKRIISREILGDYSDAFNLRAQAEKELLDARNKIEEIKEKAYQDGFEQGIEDSKLEISSVVLGLKDDFSSELDELVETVPDMIAEICIRLTQMKDKDCPTYRLFSKQLQLLVISYLKDYSSQTQLILRASKESIGDINVAVIRHFGAAWVDANLQIREESSSQGFEFSIEHSRGVLHFDGRRQLIELLNRSFPADDDSEELENRDELDQENRLDELELDGSDENLEYDHE